jgi:hypothetical protein
VRRAPLRPLVCESLGWCDHIGFLAEDAGAVCEECGNGERSRLGHTREAIQQRLLPRHREVEPLLGRDQVVVAVFADVELDPFNLTSEAVTARTVVR